MAEDLAARMRLFTPGQITWPDLDTAQTCSACRFAEAEGAPKGKVRCRLVQDRMKTKGAAFDGSKARACPQFQKMGVDL